MLETSNGQVVGDSIEALARFEDADRIAPWARSETATAVEIGLLQGVEESKLSPKSEATRAQAASLLLRFQILLGLTN